MPRIEGHGSGAWILANGRPITVVLVANSPMGVAMTKEVMWSNLESGSLQAAIDLENRTQILTTFTDDMREALAAFLEKRPATFDNR